MEMLLYFLLVTSFSGILGTCPSPETIAPLCVCKAFTVDTFMTCSNLFNAEELIPPIRGLEMSRHKVFALEINNSSLMYIPHAVFKGTGIEKIRFVNSQIMSLSDSELAFEGLEDTLIELRATDAHYIAQWDWQQLQKLHKLQLIDVNWISMGSVDEPFPELNELTALGITRAEISFIVDKAFSRLGSLKILNLKQNEIAEMKRSMFPEPANELSIIDLSDNQLWNLPKDFFNSMPALSYVYLNNNKFVTLQEDVFEMPMQQLWVLTLTGNNIRCDCRMQWLVGRRRPHEFIGTCSEPPSLADKNIRSLVTKDLWC
ncbi:hypothetical protein JTE90_016620 [Oedothorax gibbosus]|uniref:Uncharacterized protein n=1 Tax=Oedothorax gibbosus TaxID=931172 RepID=A0AAV6UZ64_9ARAC|nr:hypothetical protein JTE90_016620 [Oedothorax gibbosus]